MCVCVYSVCVCEFHIYSMQMGGLRAVSTVVLCNMWVNETRWVGLYCRLAWVFIIQVNNPAASPCLFTVVNSPDTNVTHIALDGG